MSSSSTGARRSRSERPARSRRCSSSRRHVLVMNGDLLTTLDFAPFVDGHVASGAAASLAVRTREVPIDFGVVHLDGDSVESFEEKPVDHVRRQHGYLRLRAARRRVDPARGQVRLPGSARRLCSSAAGRCTRTARPTSGSTSAGSTTTSSRTSASTSLRDELLSGAMTDDALAHHARRRRARRARAHGRRRRAARRLAEHGADHGAVRGRVRAAIWAAVTPSP